MKGCTYRCLTGRCETPCASMQDHGDRMRESEDAAPDCGGVDECAGCSECIVSGPERSKVVTARKARLGSDGRAIAPGDRVRVTSWRDYQEGGRTVRRNRSYRRVSS